MVCAAKLVERSTFDHGLILLTVQEIIVTATYRCWTGSVQATSGASRKELQRVAETALHAWPA
jgi:hypothetical protein